jgi:hypothetical protein
MGTGIRTTFCLLISVRRIIHYQIQLICQLTLYDLSQRLPVALRRRKVNKPIFGTGQVL